MVTSSGIWPSLISSLIKLKSVSEADGNPTSISLYPTSMSFLKNFILRTLSIGSANAWFPSLKSTEHQIGHLFKELLGQSLCLISTVLY